MLLFCIPQSYSQNFECGANDIPAQSLPLVDPDNFCFNTDYVIGGCVPIYLGINLHFFLNDDCDYNSVSASPSTLNNYPQGTITALQATALGNELIENVNSFFESMSDNKPWNNIYHNVEDADPQCIPIRLVLTGIHFHCITSAQTVGGNFTELDSFLVNPSTELNYFITNIAGSTNGFARRSGAKGAQEDFKPGNLAHEVIHMLSIPHVFEPSDDCEDTWNPTVNWSWDSDGDGVANSQGSRCWSDNLTPKDQNGNFTEPDYCDTSNYYEVHPCCDWSTQNNNLMTYSKWANNPDYGSLTNCQLTTAIEHIASAKCDYILGIDGCSPTQAFVVENPSSSCGSCIDMRASFNETFFELDIRNSHGNLVYDGPEIQGEAGRHCIRPRIDKWGGATWPNGFQTGETYTATISTWNDCGQADQFLYTFTLTEPCSLVPAPDKHNAEVDVMYAPDGGGGHTALINIAVDNDVSYAIYGSHLNTGVQYGIIDNGVTTDGGSSSSINISSWQNGIVAITVYIGDEVYSFQYSKS